MCPLKSTWNEVKTAEKNYIPQDKTKSLPSNVCYYIIVNRIYPNLYKITVCWVVQNLKKILSIFFSNFILRFLYWFFIQSVYIYIIWFLKEKRKRFRTTDITFLLRIRSRICVVFLWCAPLCFITTLWTTEKWVISVIVESTLRWILSLIIRLNR